MENLSQTLEILDKLKCTDKLTMINFIVDRILESKDVDQLEYFVSEFEDQKDSIISHILFSLYKENNLPLRCNNLFSFLARYLNQESKIMFISEVLEITVRHPNYFIMTNNFLLFVIEFDLIIGLSNERINLFYNSILEELVPDNTELNFFNVNKIIRLNINNELVADIYFELLNNGYLIDTYDIPPLKRLVSEILTRNDINSAYLNIMRNYITNTLSPNDWNAYELLSIYHKSPTEVIGEHFKHLLGFKHKIKDYFKKDIL